ncbi:hypothetical protein B0H34DRAFT_680297 [Crassisporium funariophilum]|nr:hypothetical protein B0H34DRAFT_680297 [Crassisporium funariophilum]
MVLAGIALGQQAFDVRNYSSLGALVFLFLDHLSSCKSEYSHIWKAPSSSGKHMYLFARYFALATQIVNYTLIQTVLVHAPVKIGQCQAWYIFLFVSSLVLMAVFDGILLLRVYALYSKSIKVSLLALPVALPFAICFCYIGRNIYLEDTPFTPTCDLPKTPLEAAILVPTVVIAHMMLWVATFAKRNVAQGHATVVSLVVHEGGWTLVILCAMVAGITPYPYVVQSTNPFVMYVWPTTIFSITSCRLIMNMRQLKTEPRTRSSPSGHDVHLSTIINTCHDEVVIQIEDSVSER